MVLKFLKSKHLEVFKVFGLYKLEWLILRHFTKKQKLREKGIKCLSLIFIDKVANYVSDEPIIKNLFIEKYKEIYPDFHDNKEPTAEHIE